MKFTPIKEKPVLHKRNQSKQSSNIARVSADVELTQANGSIKDEPIDVH